MKQRHHSPEQVIRNLAEGDKLLIDGQDLTEVCRHQQIAKSTGHRRKSQYGGMKTNDAKRLKELETENSRHRGGQFKARAFQRALKTHHLRCSMGRVVSAADNAANDSSMRSSK